MLGKILEHINRAVQSSSPKFSSSMCQTESLMVEKSKGEPGTVICLRAISSDHCELEVNENYESN